MMPRFDNIDTLKKIFQRIKIPIFYITNNADKGVGLEKIIPNYHIVCIDHDDEVDYLLEKGVKVFCLEKELGVRNIIFRNSALLLKHLKVGEYIKKNSSAKARPAIILFKPMLMAEKIARDNQWKILNNPAETSRDLENKLNFMNIAKGANVKTAETEIFDLRRVSFYELKKYYDHFVIQFASGFAGNTTFFIKNSAEYAKFLNNALGGATEKKQMPVKVSKFIKGTPITLNACVSEGRIIVGNPCFQITGVKECTNNQAATCGNSWVNLPLSPTVLKEIRNTTEKIGQYLKAKNYKGIFGLDFVIDGENKNAYLIEINPRMVASVPFYTKLEIKYGQIPMLAHHILEFLGTGRPKGAQAPCRASNMQPIRGAQLVIRNKERVKCRIAGNLKSGAYILKNGKLVFARKGYSIEDLRSAGEFIVLASSRGRAVAPESECARVESLSPLTDSRGKPLEKTKFLATEIYSRLKLKPL